MRLSRKQQRFDAGDVERGGDRPGELGLDNVERSFLPRSQRAQREVVALYVERAFAAGARPNGPDVEAYAARAVAELQSWGFIGEALPLAG